MQGRKGKVLVAQKDAIVAMFLERSLEKSGYRVAGVVSNTEELMRVSESVQPEMVVMDAYLDSSAKSFQAARKIREQYRIPVTFLTTDAGPAFIEQSGVTSSYEYVLKPFNRDELIEALDNLSTRDPIAEAG